MKSTFALLIIAMSILGGCDSSDSADATVESKPSGAIPESQLKALEKAQGVEDVLLDAEEKRRAQMQ